MIAPDDGPAGMPVAHIDDAAPVSELAGPEADLAVVIPAHNSELTIGSMVLLARLYAGGVIVADDGSRDRTGEVAARAGAEVVVADAPGGRANAIIAGCRHALDLGFAAVVLLDPGGNHLAREIPRIALPVLTGTADLVLGSRALVGRRGIQPYPAVGPRTETPSAPAGSSDPEFGFRALSGRAVATMLAFLPADPAFETAMVTLFSRRGLAVRDVPITLRTAVQARNEEGLPLYRGRRVAVVVPAHNEELLVGETIQGIPEFVGRVYVVDDASTDRTAEIVEHCAGQDASIVPIHHDENQGVGAAIVAGYRRALEDGMEIVAVMAGDNQMDPDFLPHLLDPIVDGRCDYTMGNRLVSRDFRHQMSKWRFLGNALLTLLTKIASGYWQMVDPQNGYTAVSARALERMSLGDVYPRYGYCNDLLVRLNVLGFRVVNVPHPARYGRERSGIRYSTYITKLSWLLLKDFLWRLEMKYVVYSFHPLVLYYSLGVLLSTLGILGGVYSLYYRFIENNPIFVPATVSLIVFSIGTMYWLFAMFFDMNQERENAGWY